MPRVRDRALAGIGRGASLSRDIPPSCFHDNGGGQQDAGHEHADAKQTGAGQFRIEPCVLPDTYLNLGRVRTMSFVPPGVIQLRHARRLNLRRVNGN